MRWAVNPSVVWSESNDEIRLYDTASGDFHTHSPTGSAALAEEFGAQDDHQRHLIANDTERFIRGLVELGLIVEQPSGAALPQ